MNRCKWCNINNPKYIDYHDNEWGKLKTDDNYLFEMLILETFQIGLSWECVLNKREAFKKAYNNFDLDKVCNYNDNKIKELESNPNIIRNKSKIKASINNAKIFKSIKEEYENSWEYRRYKDGVDSWNPWTKELSGIGGIGARVGRKMLVKGRKDTLYFKFKGVN